jgi:hypothetical protein
MESRKPFYARGEPTHVGFPVSLRPAPRRGVHLHLWNFIAISWNLIAKFPSQRGFWGD